MPVTEETAARQRKATEQEAWQQMMKSCRKACKALNMEFKEPEYLNWGAGRSYYSNLWGEVRRRK